MMNKTWDYKGCVGVINLEDNDELVTELDGTKFIYNFGKENRISWNQTLITSINQITNFNKCTLVISENLRELIETMLYYNSLTKMLSDYTVEFTNNTFNIIECEYGRVNISNYGN